MEKYIGNKKKILESIYNAVGQESNRTILDIFAGTTNVGRFFKSKGFTVISNDVNEVSYVLGKCYIETNKYPKFEKLNRVMGYKKKTNKEDCTKLLKLNSNGTVYDINDYLNTEKYPLLQILAYLTFYAEAKDHSKNMPDFITRNYCKHGEKSKYFDKRTGKDCNRMFFSEKHGSRIDIILNCLKDWKKQGYLLQSEFNILLTSLIEAATLFSNTSGVYEAFYKELWPNTKQEFRLIVPKIDSNYKKNVVYKHDANDLLRQKIKEKYDILYLDPPYNSRNYSTNYHLLNLIANYHNIENAFDYEKRIIGARGQDPNTKIKSNYCSRDTFEESMNDLIQNSKCDTIVISYFDGSDNLWNDENNETGIEILSKLMRRRFSNKEFSIVKIPRKNFQSKKSLKKKTVNELLFIGKSI